MENKFIKSSPKYNGIYHKVLSDGDLTFYIRYKQGRITKTVKIGKKSEGITIAFCHQQRNDIINKAKFGEAAPIIKYKNKNSITLNDLIDRYIQSKELSKATISSYKAIKNVFKDECLNDITPDIINKLKTTLANDGKAPKTINTYLQRINALFAFAIDTGVFQEQNPCKKVTKPKSDSNRLIFLDKNQVLQLKETIKNKVELLLFVELALSTGARLKTITAIKKKDIDINSGIINLQNHKSNNSYHGFISDSLLPLLIQRYQELKNPNDTIISLTSKAIQKQLQPRLNKLFNQGLDTKDAKNRVVIHTLRHTFASHLAMNDVPIFTIMKLLDHKNIKEALRYAKLAKNTGAKAVKKLWQ